MAELSGTPPTDIDPYQVLELATTATLGEVKSAYKKLALRHHPGNWNTVSSGTGIHADP